MPSAEWHQKDRYRLVTQPQKYEDAMRWRRKGADWDFAFKWTHNPLEHRRQQEEEIRLENSWCAYLQAIDRERRIAVGMLLEANWSNVNSWFEKTIYQNHPNGLTTHWTHYYNETGVEIDPTTGKPI